MCGTKRQRLETCGQSGQAFSSQGCGDTQGQKPLASILDVGEKNLHPSTNRTVTVTEMISGKSAEPEWQECASKPLKPPQRSLVVSPEQYQHHANNTSQLICSSPSLESYLWMTE